MPKEKLTIQELKDSPAVMEHLRLDLVPADLFKPRFAGHGNIKEQQAETDGYFFYVEITESGPELMLMKNFAFTSKTLCELEGVPPEHLSRIVTSPAARDVGGMYEVDEPLKDWIREQMGL